MANYALQDLLALHRKLDSQIQIARAETAMATKAQEPSPPIRNVKATEVMRVWRAHFTYKWNGDLRSDEVKILAPDEEIARQRFVASYPTRTLTVIIEITGPAELQAEQERVRKLLDLERIHEEATKVRTPDEEVAFQKTREARALADAAIAAAKLQADLAEKEARARLKAIEAETAAKDRVARMHADAIEAEARSKSRAIQIEAEAKAAVITASAAVDKQAEEESKMRTAALRAKQRMYQVFTVAGPAILAAIGALIGM